MLVVLGLLLATIPLGSSPASAAPSLSIQPITWNVVGLDSNDVTTGPASFASGVRVCNTGDAEATNVTSSYVWDSANPYVSTTGATSLGVPSLAPGACTDLYYNLAIARSALAYDTTRAYHITATADGLGTVSTPTPREIYVEHLVSQNRNHVDGLTGPTSVVVGNTYQYVLTAHTAPGGYEQLSSFLNFPNVIFQILSVSTTYTQPPGATNDTIYGDACGWDNDPASPSYRSCVGPTNYAGGKVGGNIVSTYTVKILSAGTATVDSLIYDFSGSSYHYNDDYGLPVTSLQVTATDQTDLSVSQTDAPDPVTAGQDVTYTLTATNAGPGTATGATLDDPVPAGTSFVSASNGGSLSGSTVTWALGDLAPGASVVRTVTFHVDPGQTADLSNTATVATTVTDTDPSNDTATETTTVQTSADLSILKTDAPDPAPAGQDVTYTLTVSNAGPSDAKAASVTDPLPNGVAFVSATPDQGSCSELGGTVTCDLGTLGATASANVAIVVSPTAGGTVTNTASVSSSTPDPDGSNDSASADTTVDAQADVRVSVADAPDPVTAGRQLTYTIQVVNDGPSTAGAVGVSDPLPNGTAFVSADQGGSESGGTVTWDLGDLASGSSVTLTLVVAVDPDQTADLSNTVTATTTTPDPDASNDAATEATVVDTSADLSVAITDSPDPVALGQGLVHTVTVSNAGPSDASGVVVVNVLPAGTTFASASAGCAENLGTVTCTIGPLAASASAQVTITSTVVAGGTLTDQATVSATTSDPDASNDTDSEDTLVTAAADLAVGVDDGVAQVTAGTSTTYVITLTNSGPADVPAGIVLSASIPLGTTGSEAEPDCAIASGSFTCTTGGFLPLGGTLTYHLTLALSSAYQPAQLDITAQVQSSPLADPDPSNDSATDSNAVVQRADVAIDVSAAPDPAAPGEPITYSLTVRNLGPSDAAGVVVSDVLPAGTTFVSAGGGCTESGGTVTCAVGALAANDLVQLSIVVTAGAPGTLTDQATVSATSSDPDPSNDTASAATEVQAAEADLSIAISDAPDPVESSHTVDYSVTVRNDGPSTATDVTVTDTLPEGTRFVSASDAGTEASGSVTWDLGDLAPDAAVTLDVVVAPTKNAVWPLEDAASVSGSTTDPDASNNDATERTSLAPGTVALSVDKRVDVSAAGIGDRLVYTIVVGNAGPADASGVLIREAMPDGLVVLKATADEGTFDETSGIWAVGDLAARRSATLTIVAEVTSSAVGASLVNTASVESVDQSDTDRRDDSSTVAATVVRRGQADPAILASTGIDARRRFDLAGILALLGLVLLALSELLVRRRA